MRVDCGDTLQIVLGRCTLIGVDDHCFNVLVSLHFDLLFHLLVFVLIYYEALDVFRSPRHSFVFRACASSELCVEWVDYHSCTVL